MGCCVQNTDGVPSGGSSSAGSLVDVRRLLPAGAGSVAPLNLGIASANSGGVTYIAPTSGATLLDSTERQQWASAVGAGSTSGHRNNVQIWNRDAFGGFLLRWVWRPATFVAGHRWYVGMRGATAVIGAVNPSTLTDIVGVGFDIAATQWSLMHNDGAGGATVTPLGASFNVITTSLLALEVEVAAGDTEFSVTMVDLTTGATTGAMAVSANIPAAGVLLSENVWANTGTDATTSATIQIAKIEAQTPVL
jgi:hypothetical protein